MEQAQSAHSAPASPRRVWPLHGRMGEDEPRAVGPANRSMAKRIVWTDQAKADISGIEQPIAIQILKTLGRYVFTGEGATKQLKGVTPPLIRLRAQNHRIFFREHGESLKIE